jgi:hypothetical protein
MHPFRKGFVLKCAEYGLDKPAAKELFKKLAGTPETPPEPEGDWIDKLKTSGPSTQATALAKPLPAGPTVAGTPNPKYYKPVPQANTGKVNTWSAMKQMFGG